MPTFPGVHPDFDHSQYPQRILIAISKIAQYFYVTRSFRRITIGNSEYFGILARPTDEFSVYINADRELLVILADYSVFEIRTLEAYDEFYRLLDSARIDKSIRFLISADSTIESKISNYLAQNPEYPIIIPSTFDDMSKSSSNPLLIATRRNYLLRDLFGYQNPLREETFFFGRQDIINSILDLSKSGQSSSLFGLRKSGKTSTIYAIARKSKAFSTTTVIIDCQNPAVHARRYNELLTHIVNEIRRSTGNSKAITEISGELHHVSDQFYGHLKSAIGNSRGNILVIFDEIENISPGTGASEHWRSGNDPLNFWQIIRSFVQSNSGGRVALCLVGTNPNLLEIPQINGVANPMYLFAQKKVYAKPDL